MSVTLPKTPSLRLDGKRALVTGAGRGLGVAFAAALAEAGAHVALAARSLDEIEAVAEAIREAGGSAEPVQVDVTDVDAFRAMVAAAEPFDVLVNNAGTNKPTPFLDVTTEQYDTVMDLNVRAAFFAAQAVARRLAEAGRPGSIINVTSQMGHVGWDDRSVYCTSKWAIEGLTRNMAVELGPKQIRINTIAPTFVETPMTKPFFEKGDFRARVLAKIKLGRLGQVEDLMGAVVFLASDASALMTGTSLILDGGWTAG